MNHSLRITPVEFGTPDFTTFLDLPWKLHGHEPNWVPTMLRLQQKDFLNPKKGPFFEFGEAQYFLAWRGDTPVGRLSAHVNRNYDAFHGPDTGFFGFFVCQDDAEAAAALIDTAAAWVKARGKTRLLGPLGFGIYDEVGVLIDRYELPPAVMQVFNPPYYPALLEGTGLAKSIDWKGFRGLPTEEMREVAQRRLNEALEKTNLTFRKPSPAEVLKRVEEVRLIFNETWKRNWGHVPFTPKQFKAVLTELRPMLRTRFMRAFYDEQDRLAAFIITIPDINYAIKDANGRLNLMGLFKLIKAAWFSPVKNVRTIIMGVKEEYQGQSLHHAFIAATYLQLLDTPSLEWWDCSLIVETNIPMIRAMRAYKAPMGQTWRIYEKAL
ncbi:hypothetical protein [Megalodesulfovibrio gigas]|uniref:N-acetyltransferase domain-containing protein n=1 Tax=Megalodesulfovibrio gigas (strain ATCC 19364 / DSM 1382 / NCIMB 9332 / VKM B-1759) TaxID=1121448 RepID=T2GDB5_MEGG1|nr:hypothetical protein [Megalodesulfovibrio gigas]AGW14101.1 hypothetical protein DGI_2348 [Megalodesulfovibrio gigas DSM 1382 = ATCC 19364]